MIVVWLSIFGMTARARSQMPEFEKDRDIDAWLQSSSTRYRRMVELVNQRGGFEIHRASEVNEGGKITPIPKAFSYNDNGQRKIILNPKLQQGAAASMIIFEVTNLFQEDRHTEINNDAMTGKITCGDEYAILRQLVEFDGLRHHRDVLSELQATTGTLSPDFFSVFPTSARTLENHELPSVYFLIKSEKHSGHRAYYLSTFEKLTAQRRSLSDEESSALIKADK
jgi:hypothetical protein